jgi:hypothetical protein
MSKKVFILTNEIFEIAYIQKRKHFILKETFKNIPEKKKGRGERRGLYQFLIHLMMGNKSLRII